MGGRHTSDWHDAARDMRRQGAKIKAICEAFGKKERTVAQVVKGIACPIDHVRASYKNRPRPPWIGRARELRHAGETYQGIANTVGTTKVSVIKYCRDIAYDGRSKRSPDTIARAVSTWRKNYELAIAQGRITPKPKAAKRAKSPRPPRPREPSVKPEPSHAELRRREIHNAIVRSARAPAPITLPKLRILEGL